MRAEPPPDELAKGITPTLMVEEVGRCFICGHDQFEEYSSGYDYEIQTCKNEWVFHRCRRCDHVQLDPRPRLVDLDVIYPASYYSYSISEKISPIALKGKEILDSHKIKGIINRISVPIYSYLDIGCGDGRYLRSIEKICELARENIFGLELNSLTVDQLRREGFSVFNSRVETCNEIAAGSISLITMFHVIEHVSDPTEVLARVGAWLTPGGIIALETPNIEATDARLFHRRYWGGYHFPRHWHLFRESTLTELLRRNGLELLHVGFHTGHSFWMYSFHHWIRYELNLKRLARFFDPMEGVFLLILFTGLDKIRSLLGIKTSSMLVVARKV